MRTLPPHTESYSDEANASARTSLIKQLWLLGELHKALDKPKKPHWQNLE